MVQTPHQEPGERSSDPTGDRVRLACECPGLSGGEVGGQFGLRSNNREVILPQVLIENWITDVLSMSLPIRTRTSFPSSLSFPSGSFHKPLILMPQRADRTKVSITEN